MALNIKDEATDRLARTLAAETGESITVAARIAIEERLDRVRATRRAPGVEEQLKAIIERGRRRPTLDARDPDEILDYGSDGLPAR